MLGSPSFFMETAPNPRRSLYDAHYTYMQSIFSARKRMIFKSGSGKGRNKKMEKCDVMDAGSND
jgi:hypothetical protein